MGVDVKALLDELGIKNQDSEKLTDAANKALEGVTKAQEKLDEANAALQAAVDQPDVVTAATELVASMEELELDEKAIRLALRTKFAPKRVVRQDSGTDLTDAVKGEMRAVIDASGADGFTTSQLVEQFEAKRSQVAAWVKELAEGPEVDKVGIKRGTKYYLAGMAPAEETPAAPEAPAEQAAA